MRNDALGLFWWDEPPAKKEKKIKEKKQPPEPVWEKDDYLPDLELAREAVYPLLTDKELVNLSLCKTNLIFDIESYSNYFLILFKEINSGKYIVFELKDNEKFDCNKLKWILQNFIIIGFNSNYFDIPMATLACNPNLCDPVILKQATNFLIYENLKSKDLYKRFKVKSFYINSIDIIDVLPLEGSLKIYSGRIHAPKLQDLPFHPDKELTEDQQIIVKHYCGNDVLDTELLFKEIEPQLNLRMSISEQYGVDVRSKSDAQIAEVVISKTIEERKGYKIFRPKVEIGTEYNYNVPNYMNFQSQLLKNVLTTVSTCSFIVGEDGSISLPKVLEELTININKSSYNLGIGGLHSQEKSRCFISNDDYILKDVDATSFYPFIILNQSLYPQHLGKEFLYTYKNIVEKRIHAKKIKDIVTADTLKITINGSFGKFGNKYSILYSPQLVIQTTLSGQLSLLMLIELLELNGIEVISANTDGIVIYTKQSNNNFANEIIKYWEDITKFETEETFYKGLYSRDVNNYIAIKDQGKPKLKGVYRTKDLSKNPVDEICVEAVVNYLQNNEPISKTILQCNDVRKFLTLRTVKGGAFKDGIFLGKTVRWYKSNDCSGPIIYAKSGNNVPLSYDCKPCQTLPSSIPKDLDFSHYIKKSYNILEEIGYETYKK